MRAHPHSQVPVVLDGGSLTLEQLVRLARDPRVQVVCEAAALERIARGWQQIEGIARRYCEALEERKGDPSQPKPVQDYGVTTGFGEFKSVPISPRELQNMQRNILLSHSVGVGDSTEPDDPANYFPAEVVRAALATRLNAFLKGHSGVRPVLVEAVRRMLERGIVPLVPLRGSLGASGDLCPLAHLFAVLLGKGRYYVVRTPDDVAAGLFTDSGPRQLKSAQRLAEDLGMEPPQPSYKEGLALTNGTNVSTALLALALWDAENLAAMADVAVAMTLEAICGCARSLDPKVHEIRPHAGQKASAANLRRLLAGSSLVESAGAVQDSYSIRCAPQVHGASRDALTHARRVVEIEINAVTDNPLFFPEEGEAGGEPWDWQFRANWPERYDGTERASYSAGNFHGQPVALTADFLTLAVAELASISERRTQALLDAHHNRNLPSNLVIRRGVNSGLMIAQYTAASIVSENKVLAHPASVDSIPSSANTEDHVSMSPIAARKLRTVVANAQAVLAIELMVAAQAVDWRAGLGYWPIPDGEVPTAAVPAGHWQEAEEEARGFREATTAERRPAIAARLGRGTAATYKKLREAVEPLYDDRTLDEDVRRLRVLIASGELLAAVEQALGAGLR